MKSLIARVVFFFWRIFVAAFHQYSAIESSESERAIIIESDKTYEYKRLVTLIEFHVFHYPIFEMFCFVFICYLFTLINLYSVYET